MPERKPQIGDLVRWMSKVGHPRAALVTWVNPDGTCNLTVFIDGKNDMHPGPGANVPWHERVPYDATFQPLTWHWPSDMGGR
jgi:hypothetical protein